VFSAQRAAKFVNVPDKLVHGGATTEGLSALISCVGNVSRLLGEH